MHWITEAITNLMTISAVIFGLWGFALAWNGDEIGIGLLALGITLTVCSYALHRFDPA